MITFNDLMKDTAAFLITVVGGVLSDIISKWFIFSHLDELRKITILPGFLNILRSENEGVVFGLFPGGNNAFIIFSVIAIAVIVYLYIKSDKTLFVSNLALGLILAGAAGNLWDRIWYGYVRDFIDLHIGNKYHWPTFNIADSLICIGISVMAFSTFSASKPKESV